MINFNSLYDWAGPTNAKEVENRELITDPEDPANIQFTSGTTGYPKGATLSHFNIINNSFFVGDTLQYGPGDTIVLPVPLYHCFGMVLGSTVALCHGAACVWPSKGFDPV